MNRFFRFINYLLFILFLITLGFYLGKTYDFTYNENGRINGIRKLTYQNKINSIIGLIENQHINSINRDSLVNQVIHQMMSNLDPHSAYFGSEFSEDLDMQTFGTYQGVGMEYLKIQDTFNITNILEGSPNKKTLQIGDKLLKLEGKSIIKTDEHLVKNLIFKTNKQQLTALIQRGKIKKLVQLNKGVIQLPSVESTQILNSSIGYFKINSFSEKTPKEVTQALQILKKSGMQTLVLDLRDNPGGLIDAATSVADEFLNENQLIFYTLDKNKTRENAFATSKGNFEKGKLVVLVNENSASASELLSGALQDYKRAKIIGNRTFGKGLVQKEIKLSDGSALRLTVAEYFTPFGRSIQKPYVHTTKKDSLQGGITPDVKIIEKPTIEYYESITNIQQFILNELTNTINF